MHRAALVLLLSSGLACAVSASASSQSGSPANGANGAGTHGGEGRPALAGDGGAGTGATPATPAPCVPALNDLATSLFNGRVLIHLPKGLELVEQNGFYAQLAAPNQATSCGGQVRYAAVGFFQQPANATITQVRDQLLELRGIPIETVTWSDEGTRERNFTGAYAAAQDPKTGAPPTRGWMVLREAPGDKYAYFALFETDEASWAAQHAVFVESGKRLLVKPRALQGPESIKQPDPPKPEPKPAAKAKVKAPTP